MLAYRLPPLYMYRLHITYGCCWLAPRRVWSSSGIARRRLQPQLLLQSQRIQHLCLHLLLGCSRPLQTRLVLDGQRGVDSVHFGLRYCDPFLCLFLLLRYGRPCLGVELFLRVRVQIIRHARTNYVGKYQSCMVSNGRLIVHAPAQ